MHMQLYIIKVRNMVIIFSLGSVRSRVSVVKETTSNRRPASAYTASTASGKERPTSGKSNKGRIDDKVNKTENDIALTVQILQQRLGIDERGKV